MNITQAEIKQIRSLREKKFRDAYGLFVVEGEKMVQEALMSGFKLSDKQAQAILDLRLQRLTGLEREKIEEEYQETLKAIEEYKAILADEQKILNIIKDELTAVKDKYGDDRRTKLTIDTSEIDVEDLIAEEDVVITLTHNNYIKRMPLDTYRRQNRGGKGIKGMTKLDEDQIEKLLMTGTHDYVLFFTNRGRVFKLKGYEIPEASRIARGTALVNLLQLESEERVTAMIRMENFHNDKYLFMAAKSGTIKKTSVTEFNNLRKSGLKAIVLRDDDELIDVKAIKSEEKIILITKKGMGVRFDEDDIRPLGRVSMGVRGIKLAENDQVISMQAQSQGDLLLIVSENGLGKRIDPEEFTVHHRGGKGVTSYRITEKSGEVVAAKFVDENDELMIITSEGIIIRMPVNGISINGRNASGVKLVNMDEGVKVASIARIYEEMIEKNDEDEETEED